MGESAPSLLETVNHPALWIGAATVLAVIVIQSVIYLRAARKAAPGVGMSAPEVKTAFRSGGVAAIGPSIAVCLVALALLAVFGTPSTITRIGLVGSAAYETLAANVALGTMGQSLGGNGVTGTMIVTMLLALAICGSGWMIVTLIFTPLAKRAGAKSATGAVSKKAAKWAILPAAALVGAFFTMGFKEVIAGPSGAIVFFVSAAVMALMTYLAKATRKPSLLEYALGTAMILAIAVGYLIS